MSKLQIQGILWKSSEYLIPLYVICSIVCFVLIKTGAASTKLFLPYGIITAIVVILMLAGALSKKPYLDGTKRYLWNSFNEETIREIEVISYKPSNYGPDVPVLFVDTLKENFIGNNPKELYEIKYMIGGKEQTFFINIKPPEREDVKGIEFYIFPQNHKILGGHLAGYWVNPKFVYGK